jgi:hypothetical protein
VYSGWLTPAGTVGRQQPVVATNPLRPFFLASASHDGLDSIYRYRLGLCVSGLSVAGRASSEHPGGPATSRSLMSHTHLQFHSLGHQTPDGIMDCLTSGPGVWFGCAPGVGGLLLPPPNLQILRSVLEATAFSTCEVWGWRWGECKASEGPQPCINLAFPLLVCKVCSCGIMVHSLAHKAKGLRF